LFHPSDSSFGAFVAGRGARNGYDKLFSSIKNFISSFSAAGRGFGTPSVMENLGIPKYDSDNKIHRKLAQLSEEAHNRVKRSVDISDIEKEINQEIRKLWNIKY
jgi:hypothetical protein